MKDKRTVRKIWFNGREFRRIIWHDARQVTVVDGRTIITHGVVIAWGGVQHVRPGVFRAAFMGRRVI